MLEHVGLPVGLNLTLPPNQETLAANSAFFNANIKVPIAYIGSIGRTNCCGSMHVYYVDRHGVSTYDAFETLIFSTKKTIIKLTSPWTLQEYDRRTGAYKDSIPKYIENFNTKYKEVVKIHTNKQELSKYWAGESHIFVLEIFDLNKYLVMIGIDATNLEQQ